MDVHAGGSREQRRGGAKIEVLWVGTDTPDETANGLLNALSVISGRAHLIRRHLAGAGVPSHTIDAVEQQIAIIDNQVLRAAGLIRMRTDQTSAKGTNDHHRMSS